MKKLIVGMLVALAVSALWADTLGWYRFEEFEKGYLSNGTEFVNSIPGGPKAMLKVYDVSQTKFAASVTETEGPNVHPTACDFRPQSNRRTLNTQIYGKKQGSAVVVPEWEVAGGSGTYTPSSFTVESFFKLNGNADAYRIFFAKTGTGANGQTFRLYIVTASETHGDKLHVCLNDTLVRVEGVGTSVRDGAWHHLAFAYDAESHVATVFFDYKAVLEKEVELNAYDAARALYVGSAGVYNTAGGATNWNCFPGYIDEVRVSDKALTSDELLRFRENGWTGEAVLDVSRATAVLPSAVTTVKTNRVAGLVGGAQIYAADSFAAAYNDVTLLPEERDVLKPEMAYKCGSNEGWAQYMVAAYKGYVWNRTATNENWTFVCCLTSGARVYLDGTKVVECSAASNMDGKQGGGPQQKTVEVTPGAHEINLRMYLSASPTDSTTSGGGAYSSSNAKWVDLWGYTWGYYRGIMIDRLGRGSKHRDDYAEIADTGDGDFLTQGNTPDVVTRSMPITVETLVATGDVATVDFDSCDYALASAVGYPAVVRCGNLTIAESLIVGRGAYDDRAMSADGQVTFASGAKVVVDFGGRFRPTAESVTILTAADGITGEPTLELAGAPRGTFTLRKSADGKTLYLDYEPDGLMLIFR